MAYIDPLDALDLTTETAASFVRDETGLRCSTNTLAEAVATGTLSVAKVGRVNRFSRRMLLAYLENRFGIPVDWEHARAVAKRDRARVALMETQAELATA